MDAEATPGATDLSHEQRIGAALVPGPQPRPLRTTGTTCAGGPGVLRPSGFRRDGVPERAAAREWVPARRCPRARSGAGVGSGATVSPSAQRRARTSGRYARVDGLAASLTAVGARNASDGCCRAPWSTDRVAHGR